MNAHHITDEQTSDALQRLLRAAQAWAMKGDEKQAVALAHSKVRNALAAQELRIKALVQAIADAAHKAGIYNGDVPVSGPQAIQLVGDMASALALAAPAPAVPSGWSLTDNGDGTIAIQGPGMGCIVSDVETLERRIPGEVLHALCRAMLTAAPTPPAQCEPVGTLNISHYKGLENSDFDYFGNLPDGTYKLYAHAQPAVPEPAEDRQHSPTHGMNLGERIKHVGGRENAQGYIEFGSVAAVRALILQWLRDMPSAVPQDVAEDAECFRWLITNACTGSIGFGTWWIDAADMSSELRQSINAARGAEKGGATS